MIQRKTKTPISKSTYAPKKCRGKHKHDKSNRRPKKKPQMISLEVKNTTCEVKNIMCEVKNTCWRLITEKKKILHKKNQDSFLEDTTIGTIQMRQRRKITQ